MTWLRRLNLISGALLASSGALTAYLGALGAERWVSVVFAIIGLVQLITADVVQSLDQRLAFVVGAAGAPGHVHNVDVGNQGHPTQMRETSTGVHK